MFKLSEKHFPPSIRKILQGLQDGRKRALFILLNLFRSLDMDREELEDRLYSWNEKNPVPLKTGYIKSQLSWSYRNKRVLPPNFDKDYYKGIGVVPTIEELRYKNPINYVVKKIKIFFDIPSKKVFPGQEFNEVMVNRANVYKKELIMTGTTAGRAHQERSFIVRFSDREEPKGQFRHNLVQEIKQALLEPIQVTRKEKGELQFISNQYRYTYSDAGWKRTKLFPTLKEARDLKSAGALGFPALRFRLPLALVQEHLLIRDGSGEQSNRYLVWNNEINSGHYVTGVKVRQQGSVKFYPLPQPNDKLFKKERPDYSDYDYSMSNAVGPFQFIDSKIWFGLTFYDGEGESGVGGYGYFDTETLQYNIEYKPKWADKSASAFYMRGNTMWLGLHRRGEGSDHPGGVIRYDLQTGGITHFEIPEVVHVVKEWQGAVFFGTTNGVWILASGKMTQGYFTIDRKGKYRLEWNAPRALP